MNKKIADLWIEELRKPELKQAKGFLQVVDGEEEGECCLGVLSRVVTERGIVPDVRVNARNVRVDGVLEAKVVSYDGETKEVPASIFYACNMRGSNPMTNETAGMSGLKVSLAELNDVYGYNFSEIADVIERDWESL